MQNYTEKEPVPSANDTSSTKTKSYEYDNTSCEFCQGRMLIELKKIYAHLESLDMRVNKKSKAKTIGRASERLLIMIEKMEDI